MIRPASPAVRGTGLLGVACLGASLGLVACSGSEPAPAEPAPAPGQDAPQDPATAKVTDMPVAGGSLNLVTVKDAGVEVPGEFRTVTGTIAMPLGAPQGASGELTIDLASWDSGLELRDDRVRDTFFGVAEHPTATFRLEGIETGGALGVVGDKLEGTAKGTLVWRGKELPVEAPVTMTRRAEGAVEVMSTSPFTVSIAALDMGAPLQALIELCQHQAVADEVAVSVDLLLGEAPPADADEDAADEDAADEGEAAGNNEAPRLPGKLQKAPAPKLLPPGAAPGGAKTPGPTKRVPLDKSGD